MFGKLTGLSLNRDGSENLTITGPHGLSELYDELKNESVSIEIKKASYKRSLTANAYAWLLIGDLAAKQRMKTTDVYRSELRDVPGICDLVEIDNDAIQAFAKMWEEGHLGRQIEVIADSEKPGRSMVAVYHGSSDFNSEQMSRFISNLVQDCEALGIPTISEKEAERMLGNWKKKKERANNNENSESESHHL